MQEILLGYGREYDWNVLQLTVAFELPAHLNAAAFFGNITSGMMMGNVEYPPEYATFFAFEQCEYEVAFLY